MAYYETLGQCLKNDYTFIQIDGNAGVQNKTINISSVGLEIGDFILFTANYGGGYYSQGYPDGAFNITGTKQIYCVIGNFRKVLTGSSAGEGYQYIVYIGKVTSDTITFKSNDIYTSLTYKLARLCPRE